MDKRPEHFEVLLECNRRMVEIEARDPPSAHSIWEQQEDAILLDHGPEYRPSVWFAEEGKLLLDHERLRYRRAVDDLERAGLVETWARWGRRMSHVKLTEAGIKAALEADKELQALAEGLKQETASTT